MSDDQPTPWELVRAVETLRRSGAKVVLGPSARAVRLFSRGEVAEMLSVSVDWMKAHEAAEFPGRMKIPGGEWRITLKDVEAALDRWRSLMPGAAGRAANRPENVE